MTLLNLILILCLGGMSFYVVELIIRMSNGEAFAKKVFRVVLFMSMAFVGFMIGWEEGRLWMALPSSLAGFSFGFFLGRWHDELMEKIRGD